MIRRYMALVILAVLMGLAGFAPTAVAQGDSSDDDTEVEDPIAGQTCSNYATCPVGPATRVPGTAAFDPGDLTSAFSNTDGPSGDAIPATVSTPVPDAGGAATTDVQAPQLAFTGAETDVLTWVGSGMIAAGALALVARRRLNG